MTFKPAKLLIALLVVAVPAFAQNGAVVNGKAIPTSRVEAVVKQVVAQGQQPDSPQLRDLIKKDLISREVLVPTVDALRRDGIEFRGVLYAGMMLTPGGPKVLEFNTRFGDPETQPLMARLQGDLVDILWKTAGGELDGAQLSFDPRAACCVVVCSEGYPGKVRVGQVIEGVETADSVAGPGEEVVIFQAGTSRDSSGALVTTGGRVLGVTALAAKALHVEDSQPEHLHLGKRLLDALQFVRLNDRDDEFHRDRPRGVSGS
jgi:phosphoribosylamine-glycine ligase